MDATEQVARGRRRWLPGAFVLLGLVVATAASWLLLWPPDAAGSDVPEDGPIVELEPQTVTIGEAGPRHARLAVAVVLAEGADPGVVAPREALLQDAMLREVATMDGSQLHGAQGSERLRSALSEEARRIWGEDVVRRVVLTELLIQ